MKDHPSTGNSKNGFVKKIKAWFKRDNPNHQLIKQLHDIIGDKAENNILNHIEGRLILKNIIAFGATTIDDVMINRNEIVAFNINATKEEILTVMLEEEFTRVPVYKGKLDNIIGFVHIKDLLPQLIGHSNFNLNKVTRPLIYAVPSMKAIDLLVKMRSNRIHMAVVLDEYGSVMGLLTIEDLLEQIVGTIDDEHDEKENEVFKKITDNIFEVNARISIEKLENEIGVNIFDGEKEDCETLAGLIFLICDQIPRQGDVIEHPYGIKFEILSADLRNLKTIKVDITNLRVHNEGN
jgi:CBS domain containing-hemolysin-like protein